MLFFPSLFPPALKAALHHTPPLHSPSCFDLCYQGISCVRLIGFFRVLRFSPYPLGCLELDFCSSFSKIGLNLGRSVYFFASSMIRFLPASFPSSRPPPLPPPPFFFFFFFLFWRILIIASYSLCHALLLFSLRQSFALFLPPASWHLTDKDGWFICFLLYLARKRWLHRKFARFVLFRLIKKRSFNLLYVLDLYVCMFFFLNSFLFLCFVFVADVVVFLK